MGESRVEAINSKSVSLARLSRLADGSGAQAAYCCTYVFCEGGVGDLPVVRGARGIAHRRRRERQSAGRSPITGRTSKTRDLIAVSAGAARRVGQRQVQFDCTIVRAGRTPSFR